MEQVERNLFIAELLSQNANRASLRVFTSEGATLETYQSAQYLMEYYDNLLMIAEAEAANK